MASKKSQEGDPSGLGSGDVEVRKRQSTSQEAASSAKKTKQDSTTSTNSFLPTQFKKGPSETLCEADIAVLRELKALEFFQTLLARNVIRKFDGKKLSVICDCGSSLNVTRKRNGSTTLDKGPFVTHYDKACVRNKPKIYFNESNRMEQSSCSGSEGKKGNATKKLQGGSLLGWLGNKSTQPGPSLPDPSPPLPPPPPPVYACRGVQAPGISFYASEWSISSQRNGYDRIKLEPRLVETLFPYKGLPSKEGKLSQEELLKISRGITIDKFAGKRSYDPKERTEDEQAKLDEYARAGARWYCIGEEVHSVKCERETEDSSRQCEKCKTLWKEDGGLKRRIREANARDNESEEAKTRRLELRKSNTTDAYRLTLSTLFLKLKDDPVLSKVFDDPPDSAAGAFSQLASMARDGKLENPEVATFVEIVKAQLDVLQRKEDPSGRLMKGIRYTEQLDGFARLMRHYGAGSQQLYATFSAVIPAPSFSTLRRKAAKARSLLFVYPHLCRENFGPFAEMVKRAGWRGPITFVQDGSVLQARLSVTKMFAPEDPTNPGKKLGLHVLGSSLPFEETYATTHEEYLAIVKKIDSEKLLSTTIRLFLLTIPVPGVPPFVVGAQPVAKTENKVDVAGHIDLARKACREHNLDLLSLNSDSASIEVAAKQEALASTEFKKSSYNYSHPTLPCDLVVRLFDGKPTIAIPDVYHARKSTRNAFQSGARMAVLGDSAITFALLEILPELEGAGMYYNDIFDSDKQDDGAARRLFDSKTLRSLTVEAEGAEFALDFKALGIVTFVLGELFDAWLHPSLSLFRRALMLFRCRFFLLLWRAYIKQSNENLTSTVNSSVDVQPLSRHFFAAPTLTTLLTLCDSGLALIIAHRQYYPTTPLHLRKHSSAPVEHTFGNFRQYAPDFDHRQALEIIVHSHLRSEIVASGQHFFKTAQQSKTGYQDTMLNRDEIPSDEVNELLKTFPSNEDLDSLATIAFRECKALFRYMNAPIPELDRTEVEDLLAKGVVTTESVDENDDGVEMAAREARRNQAFASPPDPSASNSLAETVARAADESAARARFAETFSFDNIEDVEQSAPSNTTPSLANILNPVTTDSAQPLQQRLAEDGIGSLLDTSGEIDVSALIKSRTNTDFKSTLRSEESRPDKPSASTTFTLNSASHSLSSTHKTGSDFIRGLSNGQKAREARWKSQRSGARVDSTGPSLPAIQQLKQVGLLLKDTLDLGEFPSLETHGITPFQPLTTGSIVVLSTEASSGDLALVLGQVIAIYEYRNKQNACAPFADSIKFLSYVGCRVFIPWSNLNLFNHSDGYFVQYPASSLLYVLHDAELNQLPSQLGSNFSQWTLGGGDLSFKRWKTIFNNRKRIGQAVLEATAAAKKDKEAAKKGKAEEKKAKAAATKAQMR